VHNGFLFVFILKTQSVDTGRQVWPDKLLRAFFLSDCTGVMVEFDSMVSGIGGIWYRVEPDNGWLHGFRTNSWLWL
jgi:hypothetical protein